MNNDNAGEPTQQPKFIVETEVRYYVMMRDENGNYLKFSQSFEDEETAIVVCKGCLATYEILKP